MADVLYLKIDRNVQAKGSPVHLRDIAGLYCSAKQIENKVRTLRLPTEVIRGPGRYVFSVLDVIAVIQQEYPSLEIENLGETDFIITVEKKQTMPDAVNWGKTVFVCVLAFFGAAFSIMAFNNDIGIKKSVRAALWDVYRAGVRWIYLTGNFLFHRRGTWHFGFLSSLCKEAGRRGSDTAGGGDAYLRG